MKKYLNYLIAVLILIAGFFIGRYTINVKPKVEYIKGKTIHDSIPFEKLVPYKVEVPANPILPMKPDTIRIPGVKEYMIVDTAAIIADYIKKNSYRNTLFNNDTIGKLTVESEVQYNKLSAMRYEFTPIQKQITFERKRIFTPFISASYNTLKYYGLGGGIYIKNIGFEAKYITDFKCKGYEFGISRKF